MLELLIALAVSAITLALAVPSLGRLMAQNQLTNSYNQLLAAAIAARQTAISRNVSVSLCAGRIEVGCHGDWSLKEWLIFEDPGQNGEVDPGDRIKLAERLASSAAPTIVGNGPFRRAVVFRPSGAAQTVTGAFAAGRLRLCVSERIRYNAIDLVLIGSGRIEPEKQDFSGDCPTP